MTPDDLNPPSAWDYSDILASSSPTTSLASHAHSFGRPSASGPSTNDMSPSRDSPGSHQSHAPPTSSTSISPPLRRSSLDSNGVTHGSSKWRENLSTLERQNTVSTAQSETANIVEPSFDENILRALCDMDCGVPLLLDRIKQSMVSCREASVFFKKRAVLEDEYGRNLQKLAKTTAEVYAMNDGKAGTFVNAWQTSMKIHEIMAENRIRFAQRLNEMSDDLATLAKEVDKNRKQTKELASRYERSLQESEAAMEKSKIRFDLTAEELERVLVAKEGESMKESGMQGRSPGGAGGKRALGKAVAKGGLLLKGKNPGNIQRQEDDIRARMSAASDTFRKAVMDTQTMRQEYFNFQLPRILRALKECADEIDLGTQYHLTRYAFLFESIVLSDGSTLAPSGIEDGPGLKATTESIDNRSDFKVYMQNYAYAHGGQAYRGPKRDGPWEEGFLPPLPSYGERGYSSSSNAAASNHGHTSNNSHNNLTMVDKGRPTFGVDLAEQMTRDGVEIPAIVEKCCTAIEKYGLTSQGIYRISGTMNKVMKLKERLDKNLDGVDLDDEEWSADINNVSSVLKLWLRELPDPLLTFALHQGFIEAAKIENDRLRHIRLHERVNDLPDPNYATLKYLLGHLHKITQFEVQNSMSIQNVAIVFGPTLFGLPSPGMPGGPGQTNGAPAMADAAHQNKAVETILEHYSDIFIDDSESTT
ncbi:GTPase activating protein [Rickenella mellea]|uniref:GTPase activating protein n=1 Tax=Rickenella mellea TaxID=50990 RepID=A0A4Y7Q9R7_9AGAM|nr:GTPase activating protein [Rickenella mellea]